MASETSRANGGLITPSMSDPWNTPGCWRTLLKSLVGPDSPMQLRLAALPSPTDWGIGVQRHSAEHRYARNTRTNLQMALLSLKIMERIRTGLLISYERAGRGALRISSPRGSSFLGNWAAAGCAHLLSDLLSARRPALDPAPYSPSRFG
jgi:D-amino-acid dehydrogenase